MTEVLEMPELAPVQASSADSLPDLVVDLALDVPALGPQAFVGSALEDVHWVEPVAATDEPGTSTEFSPAIRDLISTALDTAMAEMRVSLQTRIEELVRQALVAQSAQTSCTKQS
ncbi:hypothetical protein WG899_20950 [Paucibacter sp. AS339]|uniref:hypothetical protein n=1 Tax=Paucibacter hankyongi TaxID=3133434 RepID=UPI00309B95CB